MLHKFRLDSIYTVFLLASLLILTLIVSYSVIFIKSYREITRATQSFSGQYDDFSALFANLRQAESQYKNAKIEYFFPNGKPLGQSEDIPYTKNLRIEWYDFLQAHWLKSIPIKLAAQEQGTVRISYPIPLRKITLSLLPFIIFSLFLSWLTLLTLWYIANPLRKLINQAQSINPKSPQLELLNIQGPFEIRQLSSSLRRAFVIIKEYQASIEEQNYQERERYKWFHHELTQPNALAVGTMQLISQGESLPSNDAAVVQSCLEETSFILSALANYLGLSDLTLDNAEIFDLKEICLAIAKLYPDIQIDLTTDTVLVKGSKFFMRRVLHNLLYNARRVVSRNQDISIKLTIVAKMVCLQISDKGPGIPKDIKPLLFKGEIKIERKKGGRGIGLWYVKRLIDLQGGDISVGSSKSGGACFTIKLPSLTV